MQIDECFSVLISNAVITYIMEGMQITLWPTTHIFTSSARSTWSNVEDGSMQSSIFVSLCVFFILYVLDFFGITGIKKKVIYCETGLTQMFYFVIHEIKRWRRWKKKVEIAVWREIGTLLLYDKKTWITIGNVVRYKNTTHLACSIFKCLQQSDILISIQFECLNDKRKTLRLITSHAVTKLSYKPTPLRRDSSNSVAFQSWARGGLVQANSCWK